MRIRVVVADDHRILREGLASILNRRGLRVVGQASNGEEAIQMARELKPHILLMDLEMPEVDGVVATRVIKKHLPSIKVVILSAFGENERVFEAMKAGASAYVIKRVSPEDLVKIIRSCYKGEVFVSPYLANLALSEGIVSQARDGTTGSPLLELLSPQEQKILMLIVQGLDNKEIANTVNVSRNTVKSHLEHIFKKLHVDNRTQAAVAAVERRLIPPS